MNDASVIQALELLDDAAATVDADLRVIGWNAAAHRIYQIPADRARGKLLFELISLKDGSPSLQEILATVKSQGGWRGDALHASKAGVEIWVDWSLILIDHDGDESGTIISLARDISKRKGIELELGFADSAYTTLAESSTYGVCFLRDRKIVYANTELAKMIGHSQEQMIGSFFDDYIDTEDAPRMLEAYERYMSGEREMGLFETVAVHADGSRFPVELTGSIIPGQQRPTMLIGVTDVSEHKRVRATLKETEELYRLLALNVRDVIWTSDLDLNITYISPSVEQLRGFPVEQALEQTLDERFTPGSKRIALDALEEALERVMEKGVEPFISRVLELEQLCRNGGTVWVELKVSFLLDDQGMPVGLLGVTRDITERRRAEEGMRRSEDYFRTLIENISDLITIIDADGTIRFESASIKRITGYEPAELVGLKVFDFMHPDDLPRAIKIFEGLLETPGAQSPVQLSFIHKDGSTIHLDGRLQNMLDNPQVRGLVINARDVTEQQRAQQELSESEERYRALFKYSSDAIMLLSRAEFIDANPATLAMFEFEDKQQFIGLLPWQISPPRQPDGRDSLTAANLYIEQAREKGQAKFEWTHQRKNGEIFDAEVWLTALTLRDGKVVQATVRDITEQKQAREQLRLNEQRMRRIYNSLPLPTFTWRWAGDEFVLTDFNEAAREATQGKIAEYIGITADKLYEDLPELVREMHACLAQNRTIKREMEYTYKSTGLTRRLSVIYAKVPPDMVMVHTEDVTERRQQEEQLVAAVSQSPIPTVVAAQDGRVISCNPAHCELTGYKCEELVDVEDWNAKLYPDEAYRNWVVGKVQQLLEGGSKERVECNIACRDGSTKLVDLRISAFEGGYIAQLIDVTDRRRTEEALRESEDRYRGLVESLQDIIYQTDEWGRFTYVNKVSERLTGYALDELIGKNYLDLVRSDARKQTDQFYRRQLRKRISTTYYEFPILTKDGREMWIGQNVQLTMVEGRIKGFQAVARDVTVLKNAEQSIRASEKRYRLLADNVTDVIWTTNLDLKFTYVSPSISKLVGYTPEEAIEISMADLLTAESFEFVMEKQRAEMERERGGQRRIGEPTVIEAEAIKSDGNHVWIESRNTFLRNALGEPVGVLGMTRDISERRRVSDELRQSEQIARTLINATSEQALLIDADGRIIAHNKVFAAHVEHPGEELAGLSLYELLHGEVAKGRRKMVNKALSSGEPQVIEENGPCGTFENTFYPVMDAHGAVGRVAIFSHDITKLKRAGQELQNSLRKAQEAELLKGRFLGNMSHEFRTPLNAIIGFSSLLAMMPAMPAEDRQKYLDQIKINGETLLDMTERVLDMASFEAGRIEPKPIDFELINVLHRLFKGFEMRARIKGLDFSSSIGADVPHLVHGDPLFVERVLNNLVDNAIKFTSRGSVDVEVRLGGVDDGKQELHFSVRDTGIGIAQDQHEYIFQSFYQVDDSMTREYEGTGIGLTIARELVQLMGGAIWLESNPGQGSVFHFTCRMLRAGL
ncbi:MAG: PAS domain S-box protein [Candidatus Alcyoniella australis]|nr:PAS domain S-box protein [Candidatus Alcyoniella australis]